MSTNTIAAAVGVAACLVPIWSSGHLPSVDLPQHAAQIALWVHHDDPTFLTPGVYRFNWLTPYLGAYLLARVFAVFLAVPTALKLTVSIAVVAVPLSALALLRVTKGDGWWAVAAVPLAFGVCFYSGFLSFMMAIPVTVLLTAATLRYGRSPSLRSGALIGLASLALAACHPLALGVGAGVAVAGLWGTSCDRRGKLRGTLVALAPLTLATAWAVSAWIREDHVRTAMRWGGLSSRISRAPAALVGSPAALAGWAALALIVLALVLLGVRLRMERGVFAALLAAGAYYLAAPDAAFHTVVIPERSLAFLAILVLPLLRMPESARARGAVVVVLIVVAAAWSAHLTMRFRAFDREMAPFERILARMEPGKILRVIPVDDGSRAVPGYPLFWNVGAWYQVEKGGHLTFSFSQLFPALVRYRTTPSWAQGLWGRRGELDWTELDRDVDYFLFRSESGDPGGSLPTGPDRPRLIARDGEWRLYGKPANRS